MSSLLAHSISWKTAHGGGMRIFIHVTLNIRPARRTDKRTAKWPHKTKVIAISAIFVAIAVIAPDALNAATEHIRALTDLALALTEVP